MTTFLIFVALYFIAGLALAALFKASPLQMFQAGVVAMMAGLIYVAGFILPDKYRKRILFEGPEPGEEGLLIVGLFYAIPLALLLCTGIGWVVLTIIGLIP